MDGEVSAGSAPKLETVGLTESYRIDCFSAGLADLITNLRTGREQLLTGVAAFLFHRDLEFLRAGRKVAGSSVARRSLTECHEELVGRFRPQDAGPAVPDKI